MASRHRSALGLALLAAVGVVPSAHGQNLTLTNDSYGVQRAASHDDELNADQINRADCLADEVIEFHVGVDAPVNDTFEVWRGTGCADRETRLDDSSNCRQLEAPTDPPRRDGALIVRIGVRQILAASSTTDGSDEGDGTGGTGGTGGTDGTGATGGEADTASGGTAAGGTGGTSGTDASGGTSGTTDTAGTGGTSTGIGSGISESVCYATSGTGDPTQFTLHFILIDGEGNPPQNYTPASWTASHDVVAPGAPRGVTAGIGENALVLSWTIEDDRGDIDHFKAYCDPPPSAVIEDGAGGGDDGGPVGDCSSSFHEGDDPLPQYFCGESESYNASMETSSLQNNVLYSVAVTAVDYYKNEGKLSNTACKAPQLVRDYYEAYRQAGGEGGGGLCAIAAGRSPGFAALLACAGLALYARRRGARGRREAH